MAPQLFMTANGDVSCFSDVSPEENASLNAYEEFYEKYLRQSSTFQTDNSIISSKLWKNSFW